jgi:hypothetical protein
VFKNVKISKTCVMAMEIIKFNTDFDFKRLTLANPEPLQSSTYFTKITLENNKPFCIQLPKCQTKQGLVDIKGTKYCDLMYERSANEELMTWLEQLEYACQAKLCEKKDLWFQTELTRDDIESMMAPLMRLYQTGKYILIRTALTSQKVNGLDKSIAYNEQEVTIDLDKLDATDSLVPLIIIHGIKFSPRSFEIDIRLAQMMIFNKPTESPCLIKYVGKPTIEKPLFIKDVTKIAKENTEPKEKENTEPKEKEKIELKEKEIPESSLTKPIMGKPLEVITIDTPALEEVSLEYEDIADSISLKKPNEVYYEIYKVAREKAKQLRKVAMEAYLEAKEIKTKYMLSDIDDSDDDSDEEEESDQEQDISDQEE